jgi:hypothetical protein
MVEPLISLVVVAVVDIPMAVILITQEDLVALAVVVVEQCKEKALTVQLTLAAGLVVVAVVVELQALADLEFAFCQSQHQSTQELLLVLQQ